MTHTRVMLVVVLIFLNCRATLFANLYLEFHRTRRCLMKYDLKLCCTLHDHAISRRSFEEKATRHLEMIEVGTYVRGHVIVVAGSFVRFLT